MMMREMLRILEGVFCSTNESNSWEVDSPPAVLSSVPLSTTAPPGWGFNRGAQEESKRTVKGDFFFTAVA